ncbi:MAG: DUF4258 domain-containing protein [Acidobacteria bacterium]|nr:DUF4258 domain-containing protein [Acidobacteriota bacterium]MBI3656794.1 DUF4258 domain-containing protein [Acidobacteriota bacterium]
MSEFVEKVRALVRTGDVRISEHGYDELAEDRLNAREVLGGVEAAVIVEEYLTFPKGPCGLFLQQDRTGAPIHVVWGIPRGHDKPAVLITAYRPDTGRWDQTFTRRR